MQRLDLAITDDQRAEISRRIADLFKDPNLIPLITSTDPAKRAPNQEKIVRELVSTAKRDIDASRTLRSKGDYANAVFYLEQSVEKLTKAYALQLSFVTVGEAREVSHYSPQVFFKLLQRQWSPYLMKIIESSYPQFDQEPYRKLRDTVRDFKGSDKKGELAKIPREGFTEVLKIARQMGESINSFISVLQELSPFLNEAIIGPFVQWSRDYGYTGNRSDLEQVFNEKMPAIVEQLRLFGEFWRLYVLCCITYPHSTTTRYPGEYLNPSDYRAGLGIVDSIEDLLGELEEHFATLDEALK